MENGVAGVGSRFKIIRLYVTGTHQHANAEPGGGIELRPPACKAGPGKTLNALLGVAYTSNRIDFRSLSCTEFQRRVEAQPIPSSHTGRELRSLITVDFYKLGILGLRRPALAGCLLRHSALASSN